MMLAAAMLAAPLVGVDPAAPSVAHRVNLDGLPVAKWETAASVRAVCGLEVKLIALGADGKEFPVAWKSLRTRGTSVARCPECRGPR